MVTRHRAPAKDTPAPTSSATFSLGAHSRIRPREFGEVLQRLSGRSARIAHADCCSGLPGALRDGLISRQQRAAHARPFPS